MNIKQILASTPRLREWYQIGPVQRAELEQFAQELLNTQAVGVTVDGHLVSPGDQVWIIDGVGQPKPTTVQKTQALTSYHLFGPVPVHHSWSYRKNLERFQRDN